MITANHTVHDNLNDAIYYNLASMGLEIDCKLIASMVSVEAYNNYNKAAVLDRIFMAGAVATEVLTVLQDVLRYDDNTK